MAVSQRATPISATASDDGLSDAGLVARMAQNDPAALAAFYERYGQLAYGLALTIVQDASVAEDLVADAFGRVWREAPLFEIERTGAESRLLGIVHRCAVEAVRGGASRRVDSGDGEEPAWLSSHRQRMESLRAEAREALELAYFGGYHRSEIAERLGVSVATVTGRITEGVRALGKLNRAATV